MKNSKYKVCNSFIHSFILALLAIFVLSPIALAQIKLNDDGHVGIGADPNVNRMLNVICDGCAQSTAFGIRSEVKNQSGTGYGIRNEVNNLSAGYGVYNVINNVTGNAHGVYSRVTSPNSAYGYQAFVSSGSAAAYGVNVFATSSNALWNIGVRAYVGNAADRNRAVWGTASGTKSWAGYFEGDVYSSSGQWNGSDERFKTEIQSLNSSEMLGMVNQIQPRRYRFLNAEELRQARMPVFGAKAGEHIGVIAQELEAIFPELVKDVASDLYDEEIENLDDPENVETVITKAVNYNGLIPVLISAMQEQQNQIEELDARITALENMMQE